MSWCRSGAQPFPKSMSIRFVYPKPCTLNVYYEYVLCIFERCWRNVTVHSPHRVLTTALFMSSVLIIISCLQLFYYKIKLLVRVYVKNVYQCCSSQILKYFKPPITPATLIVCVCLKCCHQQKPIALLPVMKCHEHRKAVLQIL